MLFLFRFICQGYAPIWLWMLSMQRIMQRMSTQVEKNNCILMVEKGLNPSLSPWALKNSGPALYIIIPIN
ncbi:hypothetical protein ACE6H2_013761 [Prunus campanulata]